jgi:hypothetical protein
MVTEVDKACEELIIGKLKAEFPVRAAHRAGCYDKALRQLSVGLGIWYARAYCSRATTSWVRKPPSLKGGARSGRMSPPG